MKPHFILVCRLVGLLICVYSVLTTLSTLPLLFFNPVSLADRASRNAMSSLSTVFGGAMPPRLVSQEMLKMGNEIWLQYLITIVLSGVLPFIFGLYLLKSGKWFIQLAYPESAAREPTPQPASPPPYRPELDDRRYMPPSSR